jgi:two-component system osmolarity sensor histidine kinase EnvZ
MPPKYHSEDDLHTRPDRYAWLKSGLFWRTFILLASLIMISMAIWLASISWVERGPRAQQMAAQVASVVTITRAALTHSAPDLRRELLFDLASSEGIRVYPLEDTDRTEPLPDNAISPALQATVRGILGDDTRFAARVNDVAGFWVSFKIDDDEYWLMLERERIERVTGAQWLGWTAITLLLSLLGAVFISRLINQPLAQLATAARLIAKGRPPPHLPENGPAEVKEANHSFNQMVDDLKRVESDRAEILAGISHDLRTPITRMQLEIEMAPLSDEARLGMQSDIAQMDAIIGQFLDYARPSDASNFTRVNLTELLAESASEAVRLPDTRISNDIGDQLLVMGNPTELTRVLNNLIENARRYGKTAGTDVAEIKIRGLIEGDRVIIEVSDHGAGVPGAEIERLLRPFTRLDTARGQANSAGLGLAIVARVIKRHRGQLNLGNQASGGLSIKISLPRLNSKQ